MEDQPFKVLLIGIGTENQNLRIPQICFIFNSAQKYYIFDEGIKISLLEEESQMNRRELIEWVKENYNLDSWNIIFLIHNYRDDFNWFATNPIEKISLCSTFGWTDISSEIEVLYSIGSSIIQIIQMVEIYKDTQKSSQEYLEKIFHMHENNENISPEDMELIHFDTIGCLNDFCADKKEKIFRMRTGYVCPNCIKIWEEKLKPFQIDALFEMIEAIRIRTVVNKSKIRIRSYCRDLIANVEKAVHDKIQQQLEVKYEKKWWVEGISKGIRLRISKLFEENDCEGEKFDYTCLSDLKEIWIHNLSWIAAYNPFKNWQADRSNINLNNDFSNLIRIRNNLMHSTREYNPSNDDIQFLEEFAKKIFS